MTGTNRNIISVSRLNRDAKQLLESGFPPLWVEGEISNFARPGSGHWYFTLKDDRAQIRCAMFRGRNSRVRFTPKNGQQVIVRGSVSLYEGRGEFQMIADSLEDSGDGALRRAFEQLRESLAREGLFDEARKKPIPEVPGNIAIITSPTGAAIRDVVTVMGRRFPAVKLSIFPVQVQGDDSARQIVAAIERANQLPEDPFDLILLTRGGGSLEDLWSFNTEPVARAVAASRLPIVCAVGHESDVSIADFVADLRAPTPSAAAELITPDGDVWLDIFDDAARRLNQAIRQQISDHERELRHFSRRLRHPSSRLNDMNQRLDDLQQRLERGIAGHIGQQRSRLKQQKLGSPLQQVARQQLKLDHVNQRLMRSQRTSNERLSQQMNTLAGKLNTLSPLATLERGYAIVSTAADGHVLTRAEEASTGDQIRARLGHGELIATVDTINTQEKEIN